MWQEYIAGQNDDLPPALALTSPMLDLTTFFRCLCSDTNDACMLSRIMVIYVHLSSRVSLRRSLATLPLTDSSRTMTRMSP